MNELNTNIQDLKKQINELKNEVMDDRVKINTHPVLFVILLIGFFVTMDFWTTAAHKTVHALHPRGYLYFWEYILIAIVALLLLLWLANKSGIRIRLLGD